MIIALAVLLTLGVLYFTLAIREKDLPEQEPVSPFRHLDEKKARVYVFSGPEGYFDYAEDLHVAGMIATSGQRLDVRRRRGTR